MFRRIASYAVQAPERLPLEATNLLIAGALHFVVHLDSDMHDRPDSDGATGAGPDGEERESEGAGAGGSGFPARGRRNRFVASVREVVDAEGVQVVSNEVYRPGPDRRAVRSAPLRPETSDELAAFGFDRWGSDDGALLR